MSLQPTSIIRDFASYAPAQLEQMKQTLGLNMPVELLRICADYYRTKEKKRNPILSEIRLMDALAALPAQGSHTAISELYTNDPFVAETYADMMNKRRELHPEAHAPVTLGEALGMASAYLARAGKAPGMDGAHLRFTTRFFDANTVGALGSDTILEIGESPLSNAHAGDYLVLVRRGALPTWKFQAEIDGILSRAELQEKIGQTLVIGSDGLLPLVLRLAAGAFFALNRLHPPIVAPTMEALVGGFEGDRLLTVAPAHRDELLQLLAKTELNVAVIGALSSDARIRFGFSANPADAVSIESAFLRKLHINRPATAKLPNEELAEADPICHTAISPLQCPYLPVSEGHAPERISINGRSVSAAYCEMEKGFFRSALNTVLSTILSATASEAELSGTRLAIDLTLPVLDGDEKRLGEAIAAILGIYRAQIELAIPAGVLSIRTDSHSEHPALTVFAVSPATALPSHATVRGNSLFCVSPILREDRLPDFSALRHLLGQASDLARSGNLASLRVLCGESMTDGLKSMSSASLACRITDPTAASANAFPLAFLLESAESLPFAKVAQITDRAVTFDDPAPTRLPDLTRSFTFDGTLEILICADAGTATEALAERLRRNGARVQMIPPQAEEQALTRGILTAQLVLLCNAALPNTPAVTFALEALSNAGGALILLGEDGDLPNIPSAFRMKDGISQEILNNLFKN